MKAFKASAYTEIDIKTPNTYRVSAYTKLLKLNLILTFISTYPWNGPLLDKYKFEERKTKATRTHFNLNPSRPDLGRREKIILLILLSHFFVVPQKVL